MHKKTIGLIEALLDVVTAHLMLQARSGISTAYSEYLLYAPIVQVSSRLGWKCNCEYKLKKINKGGDNPRLDFFFECKEKGISVAMEVKWPRKPKGICRVGKDIEKLKEVVPETGTKLDACLLLVAGPHEISKDSDPKLIPKITPKSPQLYKSRALGAGKSAKGTSIYIVQC